MRKLFGERANPDVTETDGRISRNGKETEGSANPAAKLDLIRDRRC